MTYKYLFLLESFHDFWTDETPSQAILDKYEHSGDMIIRISDTGTYEVWDSRRNWYSVDKTKLTLEEMINA